MLSCLAERNIIVQPQNRGTAHGILLPLLRILERDPDATLVMVPADHYLRDEDVMIASLRQASELAHANPEVIYLLGIEPEEVDPELGYIVPVERTRDAAAPVLQFIEKPSAAHAHKLVEQGALWNSFVIAASARALLKLFEGAFHSAISAMRHLNGAELDMAYQHLRSVDFSREVLQGNEGVLQVLPVPPCGWTDLGSPKRVSLILGRLAQDAVGPAARPYFPTHLNLSQQILRQRV